MAKKKSKSRQPRSGRSSAARGAAKDSSSDVIATLPADPQRQVYEVEVALLSGMLTEAFVKKNPVVTRTIEIRGNQTLDDLHGAIFEAFDRFDEHLYEFQIGGKGPQDPKARRYVLPAALDGSWADDDMEFDLTKTTIASLGLKVDEPFGYWFDYGDDWWHQITTLAIHEPQPRGRYPKITKRIGESPPQYIDCDEEEEGDDEE